MLKLLLIGPTFNESNHSIGGTTISFSLLQKHLLEHGITHKIISTNAFSNRWLSAFGCLFKTVLLLPGCNVVMLNANPRGALFLAPFIRILAKLFFRKYVFRMFGGDLLNIYQAQSILGKRLINSSVLSADVLYLQTKQLVEFFTPIAKNACWLPTSRIPPETRKQHSFNKKFVFIGQVMRSKGVDLLIELTETRPDLTISIYGPLFEPEYEFLTTKTYYHGVLQPAAVQQALKEHDVLVLPTTHQGEGYPGVVIEAFHAGLPVIATRWLNIPEIVLDGETGILIEPESSVDLEKAIDQFNENYHEQLSNNCVRWAKHFDANTVNARLIAEIKQLCVKNAS